MRVYLGSDHAGFELKARLIEHLTGLGHEAVDCGAKTFDPEDDYPAPCITAAHRVVADPSHVGDRLSVVQFLHPTPWTVLAPLSTCVGADRPQRWAPIEAGAMLDQVLYDINLIDDARRVEGT